MPAITSTGHEKFTGMLLMLNQPAFAPCRQDVDGSFDIGFKKFGTPRLCKAHELHDMYDPLLNALLVLVLKTLLHALHVQDVDDPSDFVVLRLTNAFYSSSFLYFPTTRVVERSNGTYTR
eukprot:1140319-Pelagomonas_calceolata.AAC.2